MNINERAEKYAEGKANEAITNAIAKAYMDGYKDGYKDREDELPVDIQDDNTTYVDLGLPSGTLWAADYEKDGDSNLYLPYCKAKNYKLPTEEQWKELKDNCVWTYEADQYGYLYKGVCIGPNGNHIAFTYTGFKKADKKESVYTVYFWIASENHNAVKMYASNCTGVSKIEDLFVGYKLPVRLVR